MSIETWKREFYPYPANDPRAKLDPIGHSLQKWRGALKSSLRRHNLTLVRDELYDRGGKSFRFDSTTCSLCVVYYNPSVTHVNDRCKRCPLSQAMGGRSCELILNSPFSEFIEGDPKPMLRALYKTAWAYRFPVGTKVRLKNRTSNTGPRIARVTERYKVNRAGTSMAARLDRPLDGSFVHNFEELECV